MIFVVLFDEYDDVDVDVYRLKKVRESMRQKRGQ